MIISCQTIIHVCIWVNLLQELLTFFLVKKCLINNEGQIYLQLNCFFLTYIESHVIFSKNFIILMFSL